MFCRVSRNVTGLRGILTGASSGVGRVLARALATRGARLLVTGRREQRLAELVAEFPEQLSMAAGDLTQAVFRQQLVEQATVTYGGLDLVLAAAGSGAVGPFAESTPATLREIFEIDFFAPVELVRLALPALREGRTPAAVFVGSILGEHALPLHAEYCAAKAALHRFVQAVRPELRAEGIGLLLAVLGPTESEFWDHLLAGERASWSQGQPLSAEATATAIIRALEQGRDVVQPGWRAQAFTTLARLWPGLLDWAITRKVREPRRL